MEYFMQFVVVTLIAIIGLYLRWLRKNDDYFEKLGLPYNPRVNLITFLWQFTSKPLHEMFLQSYKKHGRIYGGFENRNPVLTVCEPDLLRDILVKDYHIFNYRRDLYFSDVVICNMVGVLKGEDWQRVRTILTPAFTSKRMRKLLHIINECSQTVIASLDKYAQREKPVDCKSLFGSFTMDVVASSAFSIKIDSYNDPENIFVKNVKKNFLKPTLLQMIRVFVLPGWAATKLRQAGLWSSSFFTDAIMQLLKERRETEKKYDDTLQLLIEAKDELESESTKDTVKSDVLEDETDHFGSITSKEMIFQQKCKQLTEDELVAQCILLFLSAFEKTAASLSFLAYSLALNPECQEKLISEVDDAFEKHKELDYDVIQDMKYLDCVLSETLRMYPLIVRSERTACDDYKLGNTGIIIKRGTIVGFNIQAMHYDPEFFPNPEKFDPERFMSENANHPKYAYLPFGAGPRICIGMRFANVQIKSCIINILRRYRFKKADTTKVPLEYKKGKQFLTVQELPLIVERRTN